MYFVKKVRSSTLGVNPTERGKEVSRGGNFRFPKMA